MSYCINICFICLKHSHNLTFIKSQNTNGASIEDKLKYFLHGFAFVSSTPKYICANCERNLRSSYEFKQICLRNIIIYEKYAQQITATDSSYKYLAVSIKEISNVNNEIGTNKLDIKEENVQTDDTCPDFVDENNYDMNISEAQSEINWDVPNSEEFIIKEENNENLVLDDELNALLHDIKGEKFEFDGTRNKNIIEETKSCDEKLHKLVHTNGKTFCEVCNKSFQCSSHLKEHKTVHSGEKPFTCEICHKSFKTKQNLRRHKVVHTEEKPFTCEVCSKSFKSVRHLNKHKFVHTGEKAATCDVCNKSFSRMDSLKSHNLIHTGAKPFTCKVCNKSFRRLNTLTDHHLVHTYSEKLYKCEICNKSCKSAQNLKMHQFAHIKKKSFVCVICNKSFRQSSHLKKHKIIHTGQKTFICTVCNKSFSKLCYLKRHQVVHTGEKPYTCEVCNKSFNRIRNLERHQSRTNCSHLSRQH